MTSGSASQLPLEKKKRKWNTTKGIYNTVSIAEKRKKQTKITLIKPWLARAGLEVIIY